MSYGSANPEQLAALAQILDDHCVLNRVTEMSDRERVAIRLMSIFLSGASRIEDLSAALVPADAPTG